MSPLFLCFECKHFSVQDNSVVLCVVQQSSLTLAQRLEGEVDPLKSLVSIVQTLEHRFWFVGFVCSHCLKYLISCLGYLLYVLWGEDPRTVCEIQNVKMKRFTCSTSGKGADEAVPAWKSTVLNNLRKEFCSCSPAPSRARGRGLQIQEFPGAVALPGRRVDVLNPPAPLCAMRTKSPWQQSWQLGNSSCCLMKNIRKITHSTSLSSLCILLFITKKKKSVL